MLEDPVCLLFIQVLKHNFLYRLYKKSGNPLSYCCDKLCLPPIAITTKLRRITDLTPQLDSSHVRSYQLPPSCYGPNKHV